MAFPERNAHAGHVHTVWQMASNFVVNLLDAQKLTHLLGEGVASTDADLRSLRLVDSLDEKNSTMQKK